MEPHDRFHHPPGPQPGRRSPGGTHKEGFGRSRGGFTSKIHARSDGQGRPLGFVLTGGEASDYKAAAALIELPVAKPRMMLADKGYDGDEVRTALLMKGVLPVIPPKSNRRETIACDFKAYKDRNRIERMFNRIKQFRRIATRYDKTAASYLGFLALASVKLWMPTYV
ncbi:IS5 family transposase, partial [Cutibacterium acnes]